MTREELQLALWKRVVASAQALRRELPAMGVPDELAAEVRDESEIHVQVTDDGVIVRWFKASPAPAPAEAADAETKPRRKKPALDED